MQRSIVPRFIVPLATISLITIVNACELFTPHPQLNEAQVEEIQSFQIETPLPKVQKAATFVLQGLGYTIENKDASSGFITAKGLVQQRQAPSECNYVWDPYQRKNIEHCRKGERYSVFRKLTITFEQIGNYTHLRLIIVLADSKNGDRILTNREAHQNIFTRIEERLFVRDTLE